MRIGGNVYVAIDHVHAQACIIDKNGKYCWLTVRNGYLIKNARCELKSIDAVYPLQVWDDLMKNIFVRKFVK